MWAYLALIVPILAAVYMLIWHKHAVVWWELALPIVGGLFFIWIFKLGVEKGVSSDTDYRGSFITEAHYYEYWETYVHRTCTRKSGKTTYTYDCSYCDHNQPYWEVVDNYGNEWRVTEEYYNKLKKRWNATPQFVELNRTVRHSMTGCGQDGDMYKIVWDNQVMTAEPAVTLHDYDNKVQVSHSAFKMPYVSPEDATKYGLYNYPERYDQYKQQAILGIDSLYKEPKEARYIKHCYQYFNAYYGIKNHVKVFVLLFFNKPQTIAYKQQAYWDGGNDNEVVVCVGVDPKTRKMDWVKSFGWCDNKRVHIEIRENMMETVYFQYMKTYTIIGDAVQKYFKPKNFMDFDYLEVDLPTWAYWVLWILVTGITIGICYWNINNEIKY